MRSQLGRLIQEHIDAQKYPPSRTQIATQVGVTKQTVAKWVDGTAGLPKPENLRRLSQVLEVPYQRVLDAALVDAGYYPQPPEESPDGAPTSPPGSAGLMHSPQGDELTKRRTGASRPRGSSRPTRSRG